MRDARAAIVCAHVKLREAEMAHHRELIGGHRALRIRRMLRIARRLADAP
jgi:hypothetical protein